MMTKKQVEKKRRRKRLSHLPGRMRAGSRVSILLVAMITWGRKVRKRMRKLMRKRRKM